MKYLFWFWFAFTSLNADGIGRAINLMYFFEGIQVLPSKHVRPKSPNTSFNTYLNVKRHTDSRFVNLNRWDRGADVSEKVIILEPFEEIIFQIQTPIDHRVSISYVGKEEPKLFWNETPITTKTVLIGNKKNFLKIQNGKDKIYIKKLFLEPTLKINKKNFIFLVIDSLRADVVGFNGGQYGVTPNLDNLAQTSFIFKKHLVNSAWTRPSTYSFLTGKYPSKTYINLWDYAIFPSEKRAFYESKLFPLPALLSHLGYRTVMIGNNPFMNDHHQIGVDLGFEEVYDFSFLTEDTPKITQKVFEFYKEISSDPRPIFLFINYNDPHRPYEPPPQFLSKVKGNMDDRKRRYLGELAFVDDEIGKILQLFHSENFLNQSFFLVTSDHGEVMTLPHALSKFTGVYTYFGHGQGLYEEDVHVPLLIRFPHQNFSKEISQLTQGIDLVPTILELLGFVVHENQFDGRSFYKMFEDVYLPERVYYGETRGVKGVRLGGWKLLKKTYEFHRLGKVWEGDVGDEPEFLYNYIEDPEEYKIYQNPEKASELREYFKLGEYRKNLYCIKIYSFENEKHKIMINATTFPGKVVLSDRNYNLLSIPEVQLIHRGISIQLQTEGKMEKEYCFYSHPDISIPQVNVYVDNREPKRGEIGVGSWDVYPENCPLHRETCLPLYVAKFREPDRPKQFRIQIWALPQTTKVRSEKMILEKDAIDILKKQGYIQ